MDPGWNSYVGITQNSDVTVFARIFPWNQRIVNILRVEGSRINWESTVLPDCQRDWDYMGVDSRSSWFSIRPTSTRSSSRWWAYHSRFEVSPLSGYCGATPNDHRFGYSKIDKQYLSMEIFTPNGTTMGFLPHIIVDSPEHGSCELPGYLLGLQTFYDAIRCHSRSYCWK